MIYSTIITERKFLKIVLIFLMEKSISCWYSAKICPWHFLFSPLAQAHPTLIFPFCSRHLLQNKFLFYAVWLTVRFSMCLNHLHHLCGFLASFDLLDSGLSQFDPVCDGLKVCTVLLHALRNPVKTKASQTIAAEYRWIHLEQNFYLKFRPF